MPCDYSPYTLPTIDFVAGETQDFAFYTYFYKRHQPFALSGCTANFSIVSITNKTGGPILTKPMDSHLNDDVTAENVLAVTLDPLDTVDLCGKYIYQITIKDINGNIEIPKQGILFITNNINKSFIRQ